MTLVSEGVVSFTPEAEVDVPAPDENDIDPVESGTT